MSDALTPDAPGDEAAVEAPAPDLAVDGGSAGGEAQVPANRFNGLMSRYQSEKSEWETERDALRAELDSLRTNNQENSVPNDDINELRDQVAQLTDLLLGERAVSARDRVLDKYPEAKPFADLIVGQSAEEIEQVAALIAERVKLLGSASEPTEAEASEVPPAEAPPEAPESGGAAVVTGEVAISEQRRAALDAGDFGGFLAAKLEEMALQTSDIS